MKKVLVLEDESSIRSFIVINLRRAGYDVIEAEKWNENENIFEIVYEKECKYKLFRIFLFAGRWKQIIFCVVIDHCFCENFV